ncbi:hypothetical protein UFOVP190_410 [uncultured Caudovirales phage]|uniref:Uncharacterized protein n=1 Tax=uncultured Caudovirales phage TaxID=2100421 RepID=A0A6J7WHQ6_9CAUD|nr:hypothetical protein UFOVP190_410 [uncultured Caudovirales phage]
MKTTEFIKESIDRPEYNDEVGMVKNNLHTLVRMSVELAKSLQGNENLPEWCQEKIAVAKSMIVAVGDYMISQHEMGQQPEVNSFDMDRAFAEAMDEADLSVKGNAGLTPIRGDKVEIKFGYNDYYDQNVTRGEVLQIRPDGYAVVGMDRTGTTENFPVRFLKVIGARAHVPNPNATTSTPLTLRPDQTSSLANYNKWAKEKGHVQEDAVKYGVFSKGGSIGSQKFKDEPLKTFDSKEEAIADAKRRRSGLSKGERGYYRMGYVVKAIKGVAEGSISDLLNQDPTSPKFNDHPGASRLKKADRYHINKDGKPASLASYADKSSAVKDRDAQYPGAKVHQVGPRGKVKGEFEEGRRLDMSSPEEKAARKAYIKAHGHPPPLTPDSVVAKYNPENDKKMRDYYLRRKGIPQDKLDKMKEDGVEEATGDPKFDKMLKGITGKKAVTKQQKADTKQQSRDAFGSMFGGSSSDLLKNLKIREQDSLKEDATGGGTGSSSVAVTMQTLGEKGAFSKKEVNKKLGGYTNQLTSGGPVKIGKAK